ncbi:MAG: hypothetical protein IJA75_07310 [Oscillospiraceae bacterium]|nr:hypothetical protein [Oscillospiraceae bacterium]
MSVRRLIRRFIRKIKVFAGKHRTALCVVAAVLLMGILLLGRYLDSAPGSTGEQEGETLPVETIQIIQNETQEQK